MISLLDYLQAEMKGLRAHRDMLLEENRQLACRITQLEEHIARQKLLHPASVNRIVKRQIKKHGVKSLSAWERKDGEIRAAKKAKRGCDDDHRGESEGACP